MSAAVAARVRPAGANVATGAERRSARVLVASDNADDAAQVCEALAAEFDGAQPSVRAEHAVADFERVAPEVVVLAFKELAAAQGYYLDVLRHSALAHGEPHRTVLLCGRDDARAAFELCKRDSFDDYVLYWPQAYDGNRLAMSVWIACRDLAAAHRARPSPAELATHAARVESMQVAIDAQIAEGERHAAAAGSAGHRPLVAWAEKLGTEVAPHLGGVRELADRVRAVRPCVMVVEDDAFAAKLIAKALEPQAWDLLFATDATQALAVLKRARPSVILMDVNLPGMDGLALTERLKATPALAGIPVLMLTGEARRETLLRSQAAGAAGFIVKPFSRDALVAKIAPFLA